MFLIEINRFKEFERRIELTRYSDHVALSLYFSTDKYGLKGFFFCGICIYQFKEKKKGNTSKRLILEKDQTEVYERSDHSTMINIKCANRFIEKNPCARFQFHNNADNIFSFTIDIQLDWELILYLVNIDSIDTI